jgi:hypothetical protein
MASAGERPVEAESAKFTDEGRLAYRVSTGKLYCSASILSNDLQRSRSQPRRDQSVSRVEMRKDKENSDFDAPDRSIPVRRLTLIKWRLDNCPSLTTHQPRSSAPFSTKLTYPYRSNPAIRCKLHP